MLSRRDITHQYLSAEKSRLKQLAYLFVMVPPCESLPSVLAPDGSSAKFDDSMIKLSSKDLLISMTAIMTVG
jgi:hypothetical protein